jgi:hypothetical protein
MITNEWPRVRIDTRPSSAATRQAKMPPTGTHHHTDTLVWSVSRPVA